MKSQLNTSTNKMVGLYPSKSVIMVGYMGVGGGWGGGIYLC